MTTLHKKLLTVLAAVGVAAVPVATADAAKHHHARKHQSNTTADAHRAAETPLTGDAKTSAENAALAANPGATVKGSSAEDPAESTGAAYEVHIVQSDGTRAVVLEDSSFTVLSTKADAGRGPGGPHGDHGGRGPGNPNETALTGDTKTSAENAALAAVPGGTVRDSSAEDPAENTGAAYEVHVTKADGTCVEVLEDSSFAVIATNARPGGPRH